MPTFVLPTKSPAFLRACDFILPHETEFARGHFGDYTSALTEHDPSDHGGATKFGIDSRSHPGVDIDSLTLDSARDIYFSEWILHRLDLIPERLAIAAFDVFVNGGSPVAWLQTAFNLTHLGPSALVIDNQLGPKTLAALTSANQDVLLRSFFRQRDLRFRVLADNPSQSKYLSGWLVRDSDLEKFLNVYYPPST